VIPVLGIPFYNREDLLLRCIRSIDHPVDKLVIIDNSPGGLSKSTVEDGYTVPNAVLVAMLNPNIHLSRVIAHPNGGVANAWNEIMKFNPAEWWLIVSNDIQFSPGDIEKTAKAVNNTMPSPNPDWLPLPAGMFYGNYGASWYAMTAAALERVGMFDENIHPCYLEDCDWAYRAKLLGVPQVDIPDVRAVHGDEKIVGSCTIYSDEELRRKNGITHGRNFDYYRRKWGDINEHEIYKTPFNDPNWPVWAWRFDPAIRAVQQW